MQTTSQTDIATIADHHLLRSGKRFASLDTARQGETDGEMETLTDQWWSLAQQVAKSKPSTLAGMEVQLTVLRRIIEDCYLTDDCHADGLVRALLENLTAAAPLAM